MQRRSPHGERGLKWHEKIIGIQIDSRSPCGERGLKSVTQQHDYQLQESLPTRGAWIEISPPRPCLSAQSRRSPHGERGLEFLQAKTPLLWRRSLPTRGAWIEMYPSWKTGFHTPSLPTRGAWIEIPPGTTLPRCPRASLPTRGAWIEIRRTGK